ncbi:hypothetical protein EUTSA_v10022543mg [Eutrema salsugineum]|uniref:Phorbol-ester/DAG-type domain-containing protein n=1 Tax=Eutrema salsugineum TaxID=72664 RepID=V4M461_EUTSA|nr:hypothetical protein EUTSA_v10022543mg [Eutrema salsugineum]
MDSESELSSLLIQVNSVFISTDSYIVRQSKFASRITQLISLIRSMNLDSLPKPESELISLIKKLLSLFNSISEAEPELELVSRVNQIMSLVSSVDSDLEPRREEKLHSLINSILSLEPNPEIISLIDQIMSLAKYMNLSLESKLLSLITQVISILRSTDSETDLQPNLEAKLLSLITQIISLGRSLDLDSPPKPESELISLTIQTMSLFNSISRSEPESELSNLAPLICQIYSLEPEPEIISLSKQIISLARSMNSEPERYVSLCPQVEVKLEEGKFRVTGKVQRGRNEKGACDPRNKDFHNITTGDYTAHFRCRDCNGEDHEEYEKALVEVKHPLHRKHSLQLVMLRMNSRTRECYCCDEYLSGIFYYCSVCDYAMNIACVEVSQLLTMDHPKWHEHTLILFPRQAFLTCDVCALADSSSPMYMCPPCDFVVHRRCINLPQVIRISRHLHRISYTSSFDQGDRSCGVCRLKINNDCGGYTCIKNDCSYVAHSRCATQRNIWDGKDFEGEPEDTEEEVAPFVRIRDGIIQHFSHEHHYLKLDESPSRDYNDNKHCQACIMPISSGNFYSCMHCEFILHETCANLSRKTHHPTHPHLLTLVVKQVERIQTLLPCSVCLSLCTGFFYKCFEKGCRFKAHVQCTTISEPLVHESHMHPLFLTSKPGERRTCCVCKAVCIASQEVSIISHDARREAFNCTECNFSLCFECATLPQKMRYKHDKHMLTLSYGKDTNTIMYWCEACERKITQKEGFYKCDEYCCVTLHIECLLGRDVYMKPGLLFIWSTHTKIDALDNNNCMSRPICITCKERCPYKIVFLSFGYIYCSMSCVRKNFIVICNFLFLGKLYHSKTLINLPYVRDVLQYNLASVF